MTLIARRLQRADEMLLPNEICWKDEKFLLLQATPLGDLTVFEFKSVTGVVGWGVVVTGR